MVVHVRVADALIVSRFSELTEDRMAALHQKWGTGRLNNSHELAPRPLADTIDSVAKMDPTSNKQYTDRLLHWYHHGQFRLEDHDRVHNSLALFHQHKHTLPERDLGRYASVHDLHHAVQHLKPKEDETPWTKTTASQRKAVADGSEIIHDSPELTVRHVKTNDAMQVLGANTSWCVVPRDGYFDHYSERGPLIHLHDKKTGERHLLHLESNQFKNTDDEEADHESYAEKHPVLQKLFHGKSYEMFSDKRKLEKDIVKGVKFPLQTRIGAAKKTRNTDVMYALHDDDEHTGDDPYAGKPTSPSNEVVRNPRAPSHLVSRVARNALDLLPKKQSIALSKMEAIAGSKRWKHPVTDSDQGADHDTLNRIADAAIAHQHGSNVLLALAKNPAMGHGTFHRLYDHFNDHRGSWNSGGYADDGIHNISINRGAPVDLLHRIVMEPRHDPEEKELGDQYDYNVAFHPNVSLETMQELGRRPNVDGNVHHKVASRPDIDAETLHRIAHYSLGTMGTYDSSSGFHQGAKTAMLRVALHPNTSERTKMLIPQSVRERAEKTLQSRAAKAQQEI